MIDNNSQWGQFLTEREGQIEFFKIFRIDYENNPVLTDNTDGVWKGVIFEFKLIIDDLNKTLKQAIKYLSKLRVKGESVPANILLVSLNTSKAYLYHSQDYFDEIHKIYVGAASKDNEGFIAGEYVKEFNIENETHAIELQDILRKEEYMPIRINEDCIVGWGRRYYKEIPKASKGDFIGDNEGKVKITGEIRNPRHFKGLILPYKGKTNEKFKYLMDMLNDSLNKQELGAFYTPVKYCEKAAELVRMAINRVPEGNNYVILDRCAGTGNLESVLSEEELRHCILSTYEYYEYKVLCERLADKVLTIIPPTEHHVKYNVGFIDNANALEKEFIDNENIRRYIDDPKYTIIVLENPPYQDSSAAKFVDDEGNRAKVSRNDSFIKTDFLNNALNTLKEQRGAAREISNLFIWSAFKYYLRQPTDSYIVFSPVKYFKSIGLVHRDFLGGYLFNRKYFHASPSAISCILWANTTENCDRKEYPLDAYDINGNELRFEEKVNIKTVVSPISKLNDNRKFNGDIQTKIVCSSDGNEKVGWYNEKKFAIDNDNIIAYMAVNGFTTDSKHRYLMRLPYNIGVEQSFGFYVRKDNFINKLPLFCAKLYPQKKWFHREVFFTTSDKGEEYVKDKDFLRSCLIYVCLCTENKCKTIKASDGKVYFNELCLDNKSTALKELEKMTLDKKDEELIIYWNNVLNSAKNCENYNPEFRYGIYQINMDLNTFSIDEQNRKIYKYPDLNGNIHNLKSKLKEYYVEQISPKLFRYELLK